MDKLRAMEYLVRVVESGSFSAGARGLDVSPPAVTKMIAALERSLGIALLQRDSRKLALTPAGERYYALCVSMLDDLRAAEAQLARNRKRPSGTLIVGMARLAARHCVMPRFDEFAAMYPEIRVDIRIVDALTDPLATLCDLLVLQGWHEHPDFVVRCIAQSRFVTCAAPAYWDAHGRPQDPVELTAHACLGYRLPRGVVLDLWKYRRGQALRRVALECRVVCDDRDALNAAALRGVGVMRAIDLVIQEPLRGGWLEPVLTDWEGLEAPPINLLYPQRSRASAAVQAFARFVTGVYADLEVSRLPAGQPRVRPEPEPAYHRKQTGRLALSEKRSAPGRRAQRPSPADL